MIVNRLAITFGDNDFYNVFRIFLDLIMKESIFDLKNASKEDIVNLFNVLAPRLIFLDFRHKNDNIKHYDDYIKITESNVLLNDEVDDMFYETNNHSVAVIVYFDWVNNKHNIITNRYNYLDISEHW